VREHEQCDLVVVTTWFIGCPDPAGLAGFTPSSWGCRPVTYRSANWVVIAENDTTSGFAFRLAADNDSR
jgi:hypothetical protein